MLVRHARRLVGSCRRSSGYGKEVSSLFRGKACSEVGMECRMQHGFGSPNSVLAAFLAGEDQFVTERLLERYYGGFFTTLLSTDDETSSLERNWEVENIVIKPYALIAPVDCARLLQEKNKDLFKNLERIASIKICMGDALFKRGSQKLVINILEPISAQINASYPVAIQLVNQDIMPANFASDKLNCEELYVLIQKTVCVYQRITVKLQDEVEEVVEIVETP